MIVPNLVGRLGNQMFQIAASAATAWQNDAEFHIPDHSMNEQIWPATFKHLTNPNYNALLPRYIVKERNHEYSPITYRKEFNRGNVILDGYWQSEKYFFDYRDEVINLFNVKWKSLADFVSIHVRRTDYVTDFPDKHPPVTLEYIRDAVRLMRANGFKSYIVCSDDIRWCKERFHFMEKEFGVVFSYSEGQAPLEDMQLLSCARHQICSNSSFSWWGHYLNNHKDKNCIMPKQWFGPANSLSSKDIYFENCVIL